MEFCTSDSHSVARSRQSYPCQHYEYHEVPLHVHLLQCLIETKAATNPFDEPVRETEIQKSEFGQDVVAGERGLEGGG
ncbi:MAG: hypothetical protein P4M11_06635 [Candidatus Pacebacteria bacterium]|nr:hypothetical protein [Candidatus Paceibacterota bacterium]